MFNFDADRYLAIQTGAAQVGARPGSQVVADRLAAGCDNVIFTGARRRGDPDGAPQPGSSRRGPASTRG